MKGFSYFFFICGIDKSLTFFGESNTSIERFFQNYKSFSTLNSSNFLDLIM